MTTSPLISIVIPSYQQAIFLEDCLLSILNQDYQNKEILVIDGGSTDGSVDIIRRYESRLAYWQSKEDGGQSDAVNIGWGKARGEVLGWLNSDDRYANGALRAVADAYRGAPKAAMWYGDVDEIDAHRKSLGTKHMAGYDLRTLLLGKNMGQPGVFISRDTFQSVGALDVQLEVALDFEYYLRIWSAFPADALIKVPGTLAESRLWEETKSSMRAKRFGQEYGMVLKKYFAHPNLAPEIRALKSRAMSRSVYMREAQLSLESGNWWQGFLALAHSVLLEPEWRVKPRMVWQAIRTTLNARRAKARRVAGKPA
jgi:glycosyltransferase involved in cell wall biosynthesis